VQVEKVDGARSRQDKYTTKDLMKAERDVLNIARERQHETQHGIHLKDVTAACRRTEEVKGYKLTDEQRVAVERLCCDNGGVKVLVGDAGTGKSSTLHAVREAQEAEGNRVIGTSSGGKASAELMASSGIESRSIAKLRADIESGKEQLDAKTVLVIDEAGMTASRDMSELMRAADEAGAKVILVGDYKQLQPVGAGETLRAIDKEIGSARLEDISRQSQKWEREAVKDLSQGEAGKALEKYEAQGRIHVDATFDKAIKDVASRHVENMDAKGADRVIAVASTHLAVDKINNSVRDQLKERGELQNEKTFTTQDKNRNSGEREIKLAEGDRVMLGSGGKGHLNGDGGRVVGMEKDHVSVKLDRTGETVQVKPAEAEMRHGYAITTHKSQGSTYDRAVVYLDAKTTSREMSYVQASRARESTDFVTTKHAIKEMRQDMPASAELNKAVRDVQDRREAEGRVRGGDPDLKNSMQSSIDYIKANKQWASKDNLKVARDAQTVKALGQAMSKSKPKETTLNYKQIMDGRRADGRSRAEAEAKFQREMKAWDKAAAESSRARSGPEQSASKGQSHESQGQGGGGKGQSQSQGMER
jgi:ATP-dependent exoDNAse (exonuclease V) alpha subunit